MRRAGVLLHPTSLPSAGPCGTLGESALAFVDWLAEAGCTIWQVLPMNPTGRGFSPYDSPGVQAGGTHMTCLDDLVERGLLHREDLADRPGASDRVDIAAIDRWHRPLVTRAARRLPAAVAEEFAHAHPWALNWARHSRPDEPATELAAQALFWDQWDRVRRHANARGIQILGDVPIFVHPQGADVAAWPHLFRLDEAGRPDPLTGVPPDAFSELGQFWQNPHYAWERHMEDDFAWWRARFREALSRYDAARIDHFRGLCAAWAIPRSANGDARKGAWEPAPGRALLAALADELGGLPLVAEDLGVITPDVEALRDDNELMGMKILQFAFSGEPDNPYLPANFEHERWFVATGTHDNETTRGWLAGLDAPARAQVGALTDDVVSAWGLIELAWSSRARWAVAPLQDVLDLGNEARMNTPGLAKGNWLWRAQALPEGPAQRLAALNLASSRAT